MSASPPERTWTVLASLWLVVFTGACQFLIVTPILKDLGDTLSIPSELRGTIVSAYAVSVGTFALMAGPISDAFGRRLVLRVGSLMMAVALMLHAFAYDFTSMLALRALAGMSSGILSGAAVAYIGDVFPYSKRVSALGWVMSGFALGQIVGIPAGTILAESFGFQAPFVSFGVLMLVAFALTMTELPYAPVPPPEEKLTPMSALRSYGRLAQRSEVRMAALASLCMMLSVSAFIVYQPTWLEEVLHADGHIIAALFLVGGLGNGLASPVAGLLSDRFGRKGIVVGASLALAAMMAAMPLVPNLPVAAVAFFTIMVFAGARMSPLNALYTALVDGAHRGQLMSLTMATGQIGFAFGSAGAGALYERYGYGSNALFAAVFCVLTAGIIALGLPEPEAEPDEPVEPDLAPA